MHITTEGTIVALRRFGETSALVSVFTPEHGLLRGLAKGAITRAKSATHQIGNLVAIRWGARLAEQLGTLTCELITPTASLALTDPARLNALITACELVRDVVPEGEPHPALYASCGRLMHALAREPAWAAQYCRFEYDVLAETGFGLELDACAMTGATEGLAYVSPNTGRAATAEAARGYEERLLRLPPFLLDPSAIPGEGDIAAALALTGWFLERRLLAPHTLAMPEARARMLGKLHASA